MKNSTLKYFILFYIMLASVSTYAQNKNADVKRCFTMEHLENQIKADPSLPAKWKARGELIQKENAQNKQNNVLNEQAVTIIPVVFHLVITANEQAAMTDAFIQRQVDVLNRDFAGLNPDSSKLPAAFKAVFGHSQIRFCLAKRTPNNVATNGIERRVTNATFTSNTLSDLKKFAGGGLDQWDGDRYLNIWAANFSDNLLGIATFPYVTPDDEQGVCIDWGTMDLACASPFNGTYDGGRTLVHEIGHYFYLYHIWGDENGCTGDDFRTQDGFPLPGSCTDDTPNQSKSTDGCLSGVQTDACSPAAPGFMYQNYMDYTNDGCYGMFTIAQVCRMQGCLDNYRQSLKTSNGCVPVAVINNDIRVSEILNPASRGFACGVKTSYCDIAALTPQVLIVNDGDAPLTSFTFTIRIDGNIITTQNWTGNLAPSQSAYINIDAFASPAGTHTLRISTSSPNGGIDGRPGNDFADASYTIVAAVLNPPMAAQSFEAVGFPPPDWRVINPDGSITWARSAAAGNPGIASARLNSYAYNSEAQIDYLVTPRINITDIDTLVLNFNVAYAMYSNNPVNWEELEIVFSEDCGTTWKPAGYKKSGDALATNGGGVTGDVSFVPTPGQWREETVKLSLCQVSSSEIVFGFKSKNNFGNNIYIDNVSIDKVDGLTANAGLLNLTAPVGILCDGAGAITPSFTLVNNGTVTLTNVAFNISIDGGTPVTHNWTGNLARCAGAEITLPSVPVAVGNHSFVIYTTDPNGVADQFTGNDTLQSAFVMINTVNAPLAEGFENNAFPPDNFILQNPDNEITWERTSTVAKTGNASMVIKNYNYLNDNTTDVFVTPRVTITNADSAFVSFDYAYAPGVNYPGSTVLPLDTLEISVSKDCGLTSTVVWKKWGEELQTINDPNNAYGIEFIPNENQWKNVRISLAGIAGANEQVVAFFTAKSNKQNNLYIDNINIFSKTLPQQLKEQGYLIYPNPFSSNFLIHHYVAPANLQSIQVFSSIGELVWEKRYAGNATTEININLDKLSRGVYMVKMIYSNKTIVERMVKN